jgi:hypothetical protein
MVLESWVQPCASAIGATPEALVVKVKLPLVAKVPAEFLDFTRKL